MASADAVRTDVLYHHGLTRVTHLSAPPGAGAYLR
jgi:hypothetical protein